MIYTEDFPKSWRVWLCVGAIVVVPVTVATFTYIGSWAAASRAAGAQMVGIAVGVLSSETNKTESQPLREWAVSVLLNPQNPPALTDAAARDLLNGDTHLSAALSNALIARILSGNATMSEIDRQGQNNSGDPIGDVLRR